MSAAFLDRWKTLYDVFKKNCWPTYTSEHIFSHLKYFVISVKLPNTLAYRDL